MKKILSIILFGLILLNYPAQAANLTVIVDGVSVTSNRETGKEVTLNSKLEKITGWKVNSGGITIRNNRFTMPANDVEIEAIIQENYMLTVENMFVKTKEEKTPGDSITARSTQNSDYAFWKWDATGMTLTTNDQFSNEFTFTMPTEDVTLVATHKVIVNEPHLGAGMTPLNWNESKNEWESTNVDAWEYNYNSVAESTFNGTVIGNGNGAWANAKTADGSMWVWIPRYSYKIENGEKSYVLSWNSELCNTEADPIGKISVKFSNGIIDDTSEGYIPHPAFSFGNDQLTGIWVAKYEASRGDATYSSAGSSNTPTFKPGVISFRGPSVSQMYNISYNFNRSLDSHLMKNTEWGAVAYLTNAIGKIPYINNSSNFITGNAGNREDATAVTGVANAWNTVGGVKASTTHNVYGIYDLVGCTWEYVSAYYSGGTADYLSGDVTAKAYAGTLYENRDSKYVDVYDSYLSSAKIGDAVYETHSASGPWDFDAYTLMYSYSDAPVFYRGGGYPDSHGAGLFYVGNLSGGGDQSRTFRIVLTGKN